MLHIKHTKTGLQTDISGKHLLTVAQLNKGTAFSAHERKIFGLDGKLPATIETLEQQVKRAYVQFASYQSDLQRHIYLNNLHDRNQILFYRLVLDNLTEMVPLIYTPHIATAVEKFSQEFRQPRGLFISCHDVENIDEILDNRTNPDIDLIVVTDGQGVLGIGDQGIGSINIPIAKLMMYSLFGGINPVRTLPIVLDVGTDNPALLNDEFYLGNRHPRISKEKYNHFIESFVNAIQQKFPRAFLHWEDFGRDNARNILSQYQHRLCTFNDDIQGTGAVALSAVLSAMQKSNHSVDEQKIVIFGAGSAGIGIADQLFRSLLKQGLSPHAAKNKFWLVDRNGLIIKNSPDLTEGQQKYAREDISQNLSLLETIQQIHPTVLIGCSAQSGAFTQEIIQTMASFVQIPVIFPLSNPTHCAEATPEDLLHWTNAKALIASGSPFEPVVYQDKTYHIPQCNNALVFPGIGLGVLAARPKLLTDDMLLMAAETLSRFNQEGILPELIHSQPACIAIAKSIVRKSVKHHLNQVALPCNVGSDHELENYLTSIFWKPQYLPMEKI